MVSTIAFAYRRPGLDRDRFNEHWNRIHGPLIARLDYLRGYTQNMVAPARALPPGLSVAPFDGIASFYWDDLDAAHRPPTDPEFTEHGKPDEPNFLDLDRLVLIQAQPSFVEPTSGSAAVKAIIIIARAADASADDFGDHCLVSWRSSDLPPAGLDGCVVHLALPADGELPAAAVIETWWSHAGAFDAWAEGAEASAFFGAPSVDADGSSVFFARELDVLDPPAALTAA